jgi:cation diffusion facilitator CzcD-associated flavoprotein CzcO
MKNGEVVTMDLNITTFTPALSTSHSIESYTHRGTNPKPETDKDKTGFSGEAAIIDFSSEAINKSRSTENSKETETGSLKTAKNQDDRGMNPAEKQMVQKLQLSDLHVKMHEQQHMASAGSYARGGPSFQYIMGPDGKSYAVGGEVALDTSPISNNPQATITKAQVLRRAALAPSDPSGADRAIAAAATQMEAQARAELLNQKSEKTGVHPDTGDATSGRNGNYYMRVYRNSLHSYRIGNYFNKIA